MYRLVPIVLLSILTVVPVLSRTAADKRPTQPRSAASALPAYCTAVHNVGKIALSITNQGVLGNNYGWRGELDCFTGERTRSCDYPKGSGSRYLYGAAFWIGAVVGDDTLVSTGADGWAQQANEYHPDEFPNGRLVYRSTIDPRKPEYEDAVSEQDYIAVITDTFISGVSGIQLDEIDNRMHIPLNLEITQRSYAWSYSYTEDFVLFDCSIRNIGTEKLSEVYIGLFVDADIHHRSANAGYADDISGFMAKAQAFYLPVVCPDSDNVNIAWSADNDGDLSDPIDTRAPHITGIRLLRPSAETVSPSFNWWISHGNSAYDFGPQRVVSYRDFGTGGLGTPAGDRNKYHVLSNGEVDYDQLFEVYMFSDSEWVPRPPALINLFYWEDTRYLLSVGPFEIEPGEDEPFTFAYIAGEDFHTDPDNIDNLPDNPDLFYEGVNFSDLGRNGIYADWIYDNPGVDTDSDGYAGELDTCYLGGDSTWWHVVTTIDTADGTVDTIIDTIWTWPEIHFIYRSGDGVPDFRAASAPQAPVFWVEPQVKALRIRWNGFDAERSFDMFSQRRDFEGYNVYLASTPTPTGFAKVASYDVEDYRVHVWVDPVRRWQVIDYPYGLVALCCLYAPGGCADRGWHPDNHGMSNPIRVGDSILCFSRVGVNASKLGFETPIVKRYPDAIRPIEEWIEDTTLIVLLPDSLRSRVLTEDGYFQFYEYEYTIPNLLPDVSYWVAVTAFDNGSIVPDITPQESPIVHVSIEGVPLDGILPCCVGMTGNVDGDPLDLVTVGDLTAMVDYLFVTQTAPVCVQEANCDGDAQGMIDIGDLTALIDYLFISFTPPALCL